MCIARVVGIALMLCAALGCGARQNPSPQTTEKKSAPAAPAQAPTPKEKAADAAPSWPTYHGAASLNGFADISLPDALVQVWRFDAGGAIANTPVADKDHICVADAKGIVHALDLNGKQVWSKAFTTPGHDGRPPMHVDFDAPLVLFDGTLIACTSDGTVYALNVTNGDLRWQCETGWPILGSPNVTDVRVGGNLEKRLFVIGQSEGALQSIDFKTGKLLWKGKSIARCDGSPAVNESAAVYGSCASALHIFTASTGAVLHELSLDQDSQVAGGVVLLGDSIYSGCRSGKFIHASAQSGKAIWTNTDCDGEAMATPAVSADRIVFTANNSIIYALERQSGKLKWKQTLKDTGSSPVIARDKVLVTAGGTLYMLGLADGKTLWSFAVSDDTTSPAIVGALVVVGAGDGTVTAFGAKKGT